ncbi:MAG: hypothetical protein L0I95_09065 [Tetragenococcus koreensis]|nr:hypothetical protein [Tetragenococcus koreensis]MDN6606478.1 hypothetical protein [Tetragenococcus halophilus]MDN6626328.1 hypothetical protein [Pisciglobus halotolerans]MDN6749111.1 hypothetical protein [Staphylococcus equorum]MDN6139894.1 hypothetical protein [Tetragenococcus koreensis]
MSESEKEVVKKVDDVGKPPFIKEEAHVSIATVSTMDALKFLQPLIKEVLLKNQETIVFIQKRETRYRLYIQSDTDYIYDNGNFGFGYLGAGAHGLVDLLVSFGQYDREFLEDLVLTSVHSSNAYIEVPFS